MTDSTFRCFNCNERFEIVEQAHNLGGELHCSKCAVCACGAPATTLDADGSISCGKCPGSQPDRRINKQVCSCGHVANVDFAASMWACMNCGLMQESTAGDDTDLPLYDPNDFRDHMVGR